ncbi:hypothetical protein D3C78_719360 [compost metagenome]
MILESFQIAILSLVIELVDEACLDFQQQPVGIVDQAVRLNRHTYGFVNFVFGGENIDFANAVGNQ